MGDGGERLHAWMAGNGTDGEIDVAVRRDVDASVGAAVIGRRTFDLGVGLWGGTPWPGVPSFVVPHRARQDLLGNNGGTFAFDGLQAAVGGAIGPSTRTSLSPAACLAPVTGTVTHLRYRVQR